MWAKRLQIGQKSSKVTLMYSQHADVATGSNSAQARVGSDQCESTLAGDGYEATGTCASAA